MEVNKLISSRDSQTAFSDAVELIRGIINRVKERNPQYGFEFLFLEEGSDKA